MQNFCPSNEIRKEDRKERCHSSAVGIHAHSRIHTQVQMNPSTYAESNRQRLLWNPFQIQLMGAMHYKQCKLVFVCFISNEHTIWTNKPISKQWKWWDSKKNSTDNVNYIVDYSKVIYPSPPNLNVHISYKNKNVIPQNPTWDTLPVPKKLSRMI